jgi:hypothetical protein
MIDVMIVESGALEGLETSRHVFNTPARGAGARLIGAQRSTLGETLRAVAGVGSSAWRLHRDDDIALFTSRFDIPVRVSNLFQRVGAVNNWFQPARLA